MYIAQVFMSSLAAGSEFVYCAFNLPGRHSPRCRRGTVPVGANSFKRQEAGDLQPSAFLQVLVRQVLTTKHALKQALATLPLHFQCAYLCNDSTRIKVLTTLSPPPC